MLFESLSHFTFHINFKFWVWNYAEQGIQSERKITVIGRKEFPVIFHLSNVYTGYVIDSYSNLIFASDEETTNEVIVMNIISLCIHFLFYLFCYHFCFGVSDRPITSKGAV